MEILTESDIIEIARASLPLPSEHPDETIKIDVPPAPVQSVSIRGLANRMFYPSQIHVCFHKERIDGLVVGWDWYMIDWTFDSE